MAHILVQTACSEHRATHGSRLESRDTADTALMRCDTRHQFIGVFSKATQWPASANVTAARTSLLRGLADDGERTEADHVLHADPDQVLGVRRQTVDLVALSDEQRRR